MERYIDHSGTGASPTVYERGKPPGGTLTMTEDVWIKKVPPARVSMIEDANTVRQVNSVTRTNGVETHSLQVRATKPNIDGTVDVKVAATTESSSSKGTGIPPLVIGAIVLAVLGVGGVTAWGAYQGQKKINEALGPIGYVLAIGGGLYLGGKVGSPYFGAVAGAASIYLYNRMKDDS